jgi:hypothetical protein
MSVKETKFFSAYRLLLTLKVDLYRVGNERYPTGFDTVFGHKPIQMSV